MTLYTLDKTHPELPENGDVWIAPSAQVIGRVSLAQGVGIWFGAVLRGDDELIAIGENSNIQENAILHTDPSYALCVGRQCTIGHGAIIHGCTLGDQVLVGMGATVLNGAKIGSNCLIGAGALVTEGKTFDAGQLIIGSPAKAVRTLTDDEIAGLQLSAQQYVANMRRFKASLKPLSSR